MDVLVKDKIKIADQMLSRAIKLEEQFKFIIGNARPDFLKAVGDAISECSKAAKLLSGRANSWEIAAGIGTIDNELRRFRNLAESFSPGEIKTVASHTYVLTTQSDMDSFDHAYKMYSADPVNDRIYSGLAELIKSTVDDAEREYKKNPSAAILYAYFLSSRMAAATTKDEQRELELALDRAKDSAITESENKSARLTWPLQRFAIMPAKQHLSLTEILADGAIGGAAGAVKKSSAEPLTLEKFIAAFKIKKINVFVMTMITGSAVSYDISTLTTPSQMEATAGVSSQVLARYNTVHKYETGSSLATSGKFAGNLFSAGPLVRKTLVLRTIDGNTYDVMRMAAADSRDVFIDISVIEKILRGPSSRIDAYQTIKAKSFAKFIMPAPLESESIKKTNKLLIQDLVNRITGRIIQYIDTSLVPLPENPRDLEAAISDPRFVEIMAEEFLGSYRECGISADTPSDEMLGTFISDLESNIIVQFSRSIKLNMIELGPGPTLFRDYRGDALRTRLYNIFVDVIKRSVSSSILTKENVYEKILVKDEWLATLKQQLSKANDR